MSRIIYIPILCSMLMTSVSVFGQTDSLSKAAVPLHVSTIGQIVQSYFDLISGPAGPRDWKKIQNLFLPRAQVHAIRYDVNGVPKARLGTLNNYIENADPFLNTHDFYQEEIAKKVDYYANIAQVFSSYYLVYNKSGNASQYEDRGLVSFQLVFEKNRWWIVNLIWNSEISDQPIPDEFLGNTSYIEPSLQEPVTQKTEKVYAMETVEKTPVFSGGPSAMMNYLAEHSGLSPELRKASIKGKVKLQFVVNAKGKVEQIDVLESPDDRLSETAKNILLGMPSWKPGTISGQPVAVRYVPVTLLLE